MFAGIEYKQMEVDKLQVAKLVTGTLRDLSARKLEKLRVAYAQNQTFNQALSDTYRLVKFEAAKQQVTSPTVRPGTRLAVAFTSNKHFYGSLNRDVIVEFLKSAHRDAELLVIGETGRRYVEDLAEVDPKQFRFLTFSDDLPNDEEIHEFITQTQVFENVYFFYSKFQTVFVQSPSVKDVAYTPLEQTSPGDLAQYFFEPEIPHMLDFFDTQVRFALFKQIVLDVEVARTAARMMAMNRAEGQATDLVREAEKALHREIMSMSTKRILNTYAGLQKWS